MKKIIAICWFSLLGPNLVFSQIDSLNIGFITPGGFQDTVFDQNGQTCLLKNISVTPNVVNATTCTAGYFNLYYAPNSGLDQLSNPVHAAKRDILCKLFTDISNFINSPLSAPSNTTRVNILIADPSAALAQNPVFRAGAAAFYCAAASPASPNPGIVDTEIYKTIISGVNSYSNVAAPLNIFNGTLFYHGQMVFNPNINWNLNINSATMANQNDNDFYSVALHELCHLLGFGSNINYGGVSVFGAANNYFSRYDKFLFTTGGTPLLSNTTSTCGNYNNAFNISPSLIAPSSCSNSPSNITNCNSSIRYVGSTNVAVFTPSCYMSGGSLSHFEDMCSVPAAFSTTCPSIPAPTTNNDLYYVMSNAGGSGDCFIKRYLKPEERSVLCDLGYNVNSQYNPVSGATYPATVTAGAAFNYTTSCNLNVPLGINDGISAGNLIYSSGTNTVTFPISAIMANDVNTSTISCIEAVYNNGVVSVNGNTITFVANVGVSGPILLRYLPKNSNGVQGNITYIYGFIKPANCSPANACNLVQNGGFENIPTSICGIVMGANSPYCWVNTSLMGSTPDLYAKPTCTAGGNILGVNTNNYVPIVNTYNPANVNNKHCIGVTSSTFASTVGPYVELMKNYLSSPLIPGSVYVLNCWLYNVSNTLVTNPVNTFSNSMVMSFATDQSYGSSYGGNVMPGTSLYSIASLTTSLINGIAQVNKWIPYTATFTFNPPGSAQHNVLYFGIDAFATYQSGFSNANYMFIDDISIVPASQSPTITLPGTVTCISSTFTDLAQYALPSGGVFSGPGVTFNGTQYSFNAAQTLTPGTYGITYTFTNSLGCQENSSFPISIIPYTAGPVTFTLPPQICQANLNIADMTTLISPSLLGYTGVFSGPGVFQVSSTPPVYGLNGTSATLGIKTYTYNNAGCGVNITATTNILPPFNVSILNLSSQTCLTSAQNLTLVATSNSTNVTYTWMPGSAPGAAVIISPTTTTAYTVTGQTGACVTSATTLVNVIPALTFTNLPTAGCTGGSFNLPTLLAPGSPTTGLWSAPGLVINSNVLQIPSGTTPGVYTVSYVYTAAQGCTLGIQFPLSVVMTPTITTNGPLRHCTNIPGYASTLIATPNSTVPLTYTWTPGNLSGFSPTVIPTGTASSVDYFVVASNGTCTSASAVAAVNLYSMCCGSNTSATTFQYFNTPSLGSATLSGLYAINQDLTITGNVSLDGEYFVAPNVTITVAPGAHLHTKGIHNPDQRSAKIHLLSCYNMWSGIVVNNGGRVEFEDRDLIEDALCAISSNGCTNTSTVMANYDVILNNVAFNRNYIGVSIKNYTQTANNASPFAIGGCVFTSRTLSYLSSLVNNTGLPIWPTSIGLSGITTYTNTLKSPYDIGFYPPTNLKLPHNGTAPFAGVHIENSGLTVNPAATNPTYYSIVVGDVYYSNNGRNIYDNLDNGIFSLNSNVTCFYSVFQNGRVISLSGSVPGGQGIWALNQSTNPLNYNSYVNLVAPVSPTANFNRFYNLKHGVKADNIFQLNVQYSQFRSTQSTTASPVSGNYGINIMGNRFKNYTINNNSFLNLNIGVYLLTYPGPINIGTPTYGQLWGTVNIRNNSFSATTFSNTYMYHGIVAENALNTKGGTGALGAGFVTTTPNNGLRIHDNSFDRVLRGIWILNFNNSLFGKFAANNSIKLIADPWNLVPQWGVKCENNYFAVVNTNTISAFTTSTLNALSGVYFSMNTNSSVQCNSLVTLPRGSEFKGLNSGTQWKMNMMNTNSRGMQLSSNGIIGQQGSTTAPSDNFWVGTWSGTNRNTWTDNSLASQSKISRRTLTGYNPLNNAGTILALSYWTSSNFLSGNNGAAYPPCIPFGLPTKGPGPGKSDLSIAIANGAVAYTGNYTAETEEINKIHLFHDLEEDTALLNSHVGLTSFYTTQLSTEIGAYAQVDEYLAQGDALNAAAVLSGFSDNTEIQANTRQFFTLYMKFTDPGVVLSAQDSADLGDLASKCPFVDGQIIYNARTLRNMVEGKVYVYSDEGCDNDMDNLMVGESDGTSELGRSAGNNSIKVTPEQHIMEDRYYQLYPNPVVDEMFVLSAFEKEELQIEVRDVNNKILSKTTVSLTNYKASIKLNLINGVYFVTLVNHAGERLVKKIVISK